MYNKVTMIGNLTKDNDLRYLPNGTAVVKNSIALNDRYEKKDGSMVDITIFRDIEIFKGAEVFNTYTKKGSRVFIEGRMKTDSWEKDGQNKSRDYISVDGFKFLDSKVQTQTSTKPTLTQAKHSIPDINIEEDLENNEIPF